MTKLGPFTLATEVRICSLWVWVIQTFWSFWQAALYGVSLPYSSAVTDWQQVLTCPPPGWHLHSRQWSVLFTQWRQSTLHVNWPPHCWGDSPGLQPSSLASYKATWVGFFSRASLFKGGRVLHLLQDRFCSACLWVVTQTDGPVSTWGALWSPLKGWEDVSGHPTWASGQWEAAGRPLWLPALGFSLGSVPSVW